MTAQEVLNLSEYHRDKLRNTDEIKQLLQALDKNETFYFNSEEKTFTDPTYYSSIEETKKPLTKEPEVRQPIHGKIPPVVLRPSEPETDLPEEFPKHRPHPEA